MVLVDTNVLLDIATRGAEWFTWSVDQLAPLIDARDAAINPTCFLESLSTSPDCGEMAAFGSVKFARLSVCSIRFYSPKSSTPCIFSA